MTRLIYLILFIVLIAIVALRASITVKEGYVDNVFVASLKPAVKFFEGETVPLTESAKDTWKKCNIFTCKNNEAQNDYDKWLDLQRDKLAEYKRERDNIAKKMGNKQKKPKEKQCPPRITQEELNEPVLTEEETEVLDRLDEVEGQIAEAEQRLQQVNREIKDQQNEFALNMADMQQMMNDVRSSSQEQKDMNFYETAIEVQVKPWQSLIEETKKKVEAYDKTFKDIGAKIDGLSKKVDIINSAPRMGFI